MGRPKKNTDPFADLDTDFKDAIASSTPEEINKRISDIAKAEEENLRAKAEDQDLAEKKAQAAEASVQYRDASKMNRMRIRFAMRVLGDKGAV